MKISSYKADIDIQSAYAKLTYPTCISRVHFAWHIHTFQCVSAAGWLVDIAKHIFIEMAGIIFQAVSSFVRR